MSAISLAYEIVDLHQRLEDAEREVTRLRHIETQYEALLRSSISHSHAMMGNVLNLCMTPGVMEAAQVAYESTRKIE